MCGIIGGITDDNNIISTLLDGLKRLEYRGYDSSGLATIKNNTIVRHRAVGAVRVLERQLNKQNTPLSGHIGIAHTRWATHGSPTEQNAHPHICNNKVSIVHNGIIENHLVLREKQIKQGFRFSSETDTEVIAHEVYAHLNGKNNLLDATQKTCAKLAGSYALAIISSEEPKHLVAACSGTPLVIGILADGYFIASDVNALLALTQQFIFLKDGDIVDIYHDKFVIYNRKKIVKRTPVTSTLSVNMIALNNHKHYMHKEIFEQVQAISDTLEGRTTQTQVLVESFGYKAKEVFAHIKQVQIVACGTSYHAGIVAKYWFEEIIKMPCSVEVASEYRYRHPVILTDTLFVSLSQSGETADTLEALKAIKRQHPALATLAICNSAESRLTHLSKMNFLTHAGPEISVASTKAFSTQLVGLALLMTAIGKIQKRLTDKREAHIVQGLHKLPGLIRHTLKQENVVAKLATKFANKHNALFLGRGVMYPIAKEGALKLKEVSYIHAEAYPAGELKHGPIALIDKQIPVVAIAPNNELLEKLKVNLQEVKARGSEMIVFKDKEAKIPVIKDMTVIAITKNVGPITAPIVFNVALQLLSYHVGLIKGNDVDKPRNLAKSVTVE